MELTTSPSSSISDSLLDLSGHPLRADSARLILGLRIDPAIQGRIDVLFDLCNEGQLTDQERAEYEGYVVGVGLVNLLKAKVRQALPPDFAP